MDSQKLVLFLKKKQGLSAAVAGMLVALVVLYLRFDQLGIHEGRLSALQADSAKLQRNISNAAQIDRQLAELTKVNDTIASDLLKPSELARNSQLFYTLEADCGVKLLDLQQRSVAAPARGAAASIYVPLTFSLNLEGDHDKLLKFMREIEKRFVGGKILSASMSGGSASSGSDPDKRRLVSMVVQTIATTK